MKISIVAAIAQNNVIGNKGKIPWKIPEDLKHFKETTVGHHILMGRITHESIGRVLPNRTNIILTKDNDYQAEGCFVFHKLLDAIRFAKERQEEELMVIGGEQIYKLTIPLTQTLYLTKILQNFEGDTFFPEIKPDEWEETSYETHKESIVPFEYRTLERRG